MNNNQNVTKSVPLEIIAQPNQHQSEHQQQISQNCPTLICRKLRELHQKAMNFFQCTMLFSNDRLEELHNLAIVDQDDMNEIRSQTSISVDTKIGKEGLSEISSNKKMPNDYQELPIRNYSFGKVTKFVKKHPEIYDQSYSERKKNFAYTFDEVRRIRAKQYEQKHKSFWEQLKRLFSCRGGNYLQEIEELDKTKREGNHKNKNSIKLLLEESISNQNIFEVQDDWDRANHKEKVVKVEVQGKGQGKSEGKVNLEDRLFRQKPEAVQKPIQNEKQKMQPKSELQDLAHGEQQFLSKASKNKRRAVITKEGSQNYDNNSIFANILANDDIDIPSKNQNQYKIRNSDNNYSRDGMEIGDKKIRKYTVLGEQKITVGGFQVDQVQGGESQRYNKNVEDKQKTDEMKNDDIVQVKLEARKNNQNKIIEDGHHKQHKSTPQILPDKKSLPNTKPALIPGLYVNNLEQHTLKQSKQIQVNDEENYDEQIKLPAGEKRGRKTKRAIGEYKHEQELDLNREVILSDQIPKMQSKVEGEGQDDKVDMPKRRRKGRQNKLRMVEQTGDEEIVEVQEY